MRRAATRAFRRAFLIGAVLALAAVVPLLAIIRRRPMRAPLVALAAAVAIIPGAAAVAAGGVSYGPAAAAQPVFRRALEQDRLTDQQGGAVGPERRRLLPARAGRVAGAGAGIDGHPKRLPVQPPPDQRRPGRGRQGRAQTRPSPTASGPGI